MATHSAIAFSQFAKGGVKYPQGQGRHGVLHFRLNWADIVVELAAAINPATPDKLDIWTIPVGTQIHGVLLHVVTAATVTATAASATVAVGDATTESAYLAATDLKTVGYTGTIITDAFAAATKVYAAALALRLTFAGTATVLLTGLADLYVNCTFFDIGTAEPSDWT